MCEVLSLNVQALEQVVADSEARRELLWLRAKERGDETTISELVHCDPGVEDRIRRFHGELGDEADYGLLYDACLERHLRRFSSRKTLTRSGAGRSRF